MKLSAALERLCGLAADPLRWGGVNRYHLTVQEQELFGPESQPVPCWTASGEERVIGRFDGGDGEPPTGFWYIVGMYGSRLPGAIDTGAALDPGEDVRLAWIPLSRIHRLEVITTQPGEELVNHG